MRAQAVTRIHDAGWSTGDFEAGGNIVMFEGKPLFIDIGMTDETDVSNAELPQCRLRAQSVVGLAADERPSGAWSPR